MTDEKQPDGLNIVPFRQTDDVQTLEIGRTIHASFSNRARATYGAKPIVKITGGSLPSTIDEAEQFLIQYDRHLYQRGDFVVRPAPALIDIADKRKTTGLRLVQIKKNHMVERLTAIIDFQRFDKRSNKWVSVDCPLKVAETYLERTGMWNLPALSGITNCPTLRPDGSVVDRAGYDPSTGILYDPHGVMFPPIPDAPTKEEARTALDRIKGLISEFPFSDSPSRSVALSGIFTAMVRRSLSTAPLHGFDAPVAGSGKSKLVDVPSMFANGHEAPVIAPGKTEEEMEKRLGAMLLAGDTIINLDNCETGLGGVFLCQCLTQLVVKPRILGKSLTPNIPSNAAMFATGNNLLFIGDLIRRSLKGKLDPECERPELRSFKTEDPVSVLKRARPRYVVDALTVLRAFICARMPAPDGLVPLGSFEDWSRLVRNCLIWLGEPDPCDTMEEIRTTDPKLASLTAVLGQWHAAFETQELTTKQLIEQSCEQSYATGQFIHAELREALLTVAGNRGAIDSQRLGYWLRANKNRIVDRKRIVKAGITDGAPRWRIEIV